MSLQRPLVQVFSAKKKGEVVTQLPLPDVFLAPIRDDVVRTIYNLHRLNKRHPFARDRFAGMKTAAESWGTGRAVSRIPRVPGGGTHRAGQGAFGNMCRGGRMFSAHKLWRRWSHKIARSQRRFARVAAIAGTSVPALVEAHGHRISEVSEIPVVVSDDLQNIKKTKDLVAALELLGLKADLDKAKNSRTVRTGKGKKRNRKFVNAKGPLIVYTADNGVRLAARNLVGVDAVSLKKLSTLELAPGGKVGRLVVWTQSAFKQLSVVYGSYGKKGAVSTLNKRSGVSWSLPKPVMVNTDYHSIYSSEAVQSVMRERKLKTVLSRKKGNPYKNKALMTKLNPLKK